MRRRALPILLFCFPASALGQDAVSQSFFLTRSDSTISLSREFVVPESDSLILDSVQLRRDLDYVLRYRYGEIGFATSFLQKLSDDSTAHLLQIHYRAYPLRLQRQYSLKRLDVRTDSAGRKEQVVVPTGPAFSMDELFGDDLKKSGSIFRGFSVGSNRDLSLSSGFRMQLAGRLAQDVDLVAALTDENSPIQPEGTTQTLQEVDKVYVELNHPSFGALLGDFNVSVDQSRGGEFGRVFRKLQGAQGSARMRGSSWSGEMTLTGATARGKYHNMTFQGREGNQGPYRLTGQNGERAIIVIAGTERVYLNGEQVQRGEILDYTIDYASAEVTFASRRLITNASRIVIDFEYSDRNYERNYAGAAVRTSLLSEKITINAHVMQETDDPDAPVDASLDENSRAILAQSGADRFKASQSGITFAGTDSITGAGKGQYVRVDTVIAGKQYTVFHYSPGDPLALYSVRFSFVERMPADSGGYVRIGLGQFRFAGIGQGNYLPIQFFAIPRLLRVVDLNAAAEISPSFSVSGEYAVSQTDQNRLSSLDPDRSGQAAKLTARYWKKDLVIGSTSLGELDVSISERLVEQSFASIDRANEVEFDRKWNFDVLPAGDEEIREATVRYKPLKTISVGGAYGSLRREGSFNSIRAQGNAALSDSLWGDARYSIEDIKSNDAVLDRRSSWLRQRGTAERDFGLLTPGMSFETERRSIHTQGAGALDIGSFRFWQVAPRLATDEVFHMKASAELQVRNEDSTIAGSFRGASRSLTQLYSWQLRDWNDVSTSLSLSLRKTEFTEAFQQRGNLNSDVVMVRSQTRFVPLQRALDADLFYSFSNQRSARLERVFVRVAKGDGNYRYLGDRNSNSLADENEFELTRFDGDYVVVLLPGETLYPVADLQASARIRLQPARILDTSSPMGDVLSSLSSETYVRLDERSSDPNTANVYLLRFGRFLDDQNTLSGAQVFTQDLHIYENSTELSLRFRFNQRKGLLQLVSSRERSYARERSVRVRAQLVSEISNQTEYINRRDRVLATVPTSRERDLVSNTVNSDFSYRPERQWEIGFRFETARVVDELRGDQAIADLNEQSVRVIYGFLTRGQLRSEIRREEVILSRASTDPSRVYPFEFTNGRVFGKTFLWSMGFDYRITSNIQLSFQYEGRSEGSRSPVHLARAEARAFF